MQRTPKVPLLSALDLDPLIQVARRFDAKSLTVFGSALYDRLPEAADVDVAVVVPAMSQRLWTEVVDTAEDAVGAAAAALGRRGQVELRHGPFKPPPTRRDVFQLHLLLDDLRSQAVTPAAIRAHRAAGGRLMLGEALPLPEPEDPQWREEALHELVRWRDAVARREIPFRQWHAGPVMRFSASRVPADTAWELRCLLRAACTSADLLYAAALPPREIAAAGELATPARRQVDETTNDERWHDLSARWPAVAERVLDVLERRRDHLTRLG